MDTSHPVLSGLLRKRQENADELEKVQDQVRELILRLDALDITIRLFNPTVDIGAVRVKPVPRRHAAVRNESSRLIFAALREARRPMTTRELARFIMEQRGMNVADQAMVATMCNRLGSTLRKLKARGRIAAEKEGERNMLWRLAELGLDSPNEPAQGI